ncbi:ribonuclease HII [candidate division WWE3 bacterium CG_4_10_14_0_2_um_filter_41_14]|uniref:Ribonuclease n=1 Tax=candidate division WWE3 bacterium CG_4_10_14_0_2_um_filter_41_14 TaxID=1975072 RepID=A0A2M7TFR2_UNCKA|nr:MAG: ribonuclease HII [candidate division WWE3 bacterium CG_4_10_14_0_2_um_filter_41_14]
MLIVPKNPSFDFERDLWGKGYEFVVGMDEVGRGCLCGPVVVGAVVFPQYFDQNARNVLLDGINDSKKLSPKKRALLVRVIYAHAFDWSIGVCSASDVDEYGITRAVRSAAALAWRGLSVHPDYGLFDAGLVKTSSQAHVRHLVKGDCVSVSISAASIIAKQWRDAYMVRLSKNLRYRPYKWDENAGYGTSYHQLAIVRYGLSDLHRKTFCH